MVNVPKIEPRMQPFSGQEDTNVAILGASAGGGTSSSNARRSLSTESHFQQRCQDSPGSRAPTAQERAAQGVEGKAREDPHRRREPAEDPVVPLITMDYQFYSRDGKEADEEASLATVLNLTDRATAWTLSIPVAHKGHRHAAYAAGLVEQFVDRLVRQSSSCRPTRRTPSPLWPVRSTAGWELPGCVFAMPLAGHTRGKDPWREGTHTWEERFARGSRS